MQTRRQSRGSWQIVPGLLLCVSIGGCSALAQSRLLSRHLDDDQHGSAHDRWNSIQAGMKLQLAQQHYQAGRLDEAGQVLRRVFAMAPDNTEALKLATRVHLKRGQLALAQKSIALAASYSDSDAEIEYLAGIVNQRRGEKEAALEHFLAAQSLAPNSPEYVLAAAEMHVALDHPQQALALIKTRQKDFDGCAPLRLLAARICRSLGLKGPAVVHCHEARLLQQRDPRLNVEVGLILVWAEHYEEAIGILRPLVDEASEALSPTASAADGADHRREDLVTPSVVHALARAYAATQQWRETTAVLKPLLRRDQADMTAWSLYARSALMAGDIDAAEEAISTFNRRNPPTAETVLLQAYIAYQRGHYREARDGARKALKLNTALTPASWLAKQADRALDKSNQDDDRYEAAPVSETKFEPVQIVKAMQDRQPASSRPFVTSNQPVRLNPRPNVCPMCGQSPCVIPQRLESSMGLLQVADAAGTAGLEVGVEP